MVLSDYGGQWLPYESFVCEPDQRTLTIDAVNQGNWSLSIKLRLEYFVIVE